MNTEADPILDAIERHRRAEMGAAATYRFRNERERDELEEAASAALRNLIETTPTTISGAIALLRYLDVVTNTEGVGGGLFADYASLRPVAADLLTRLAEVIERSNDGAG
jgi:hypothetical protein